MQIAPGFFLPLAFTYRLDYSDATTYDKEPTMTMTTEKLAELQSRIDHAFEERLGVQRAITFAELQALIALAERALQPEEGQAMPELPKPFQTVYDDIDHEEVPCYSPVQMHAYARAYASQLALPAGPVPEGWEVLQVKNFQAFIDACDYADRKGYLPDAMRDEWEALDFKRPEASPAVAQPVADEREVVTPFSIRKDADGIAWLYFDGGMVSLNNIANESGPIVREAMSRAIKAMNETDQPAADERLLTRALAYIKNIICGLKPNNGRIARACLLHGKPAPHSASQQKKETRHEDGEA